MSKADLKKTFNGVIADLQKAEQFRRLTTNKQGHYIAVFIADLQEQLTIQVRSQQENSNEPLPRGLQSVVDDEAKKLLNRVAKELKIQVDNNFGRRKVLATKFIHKVGESIEMAVEQEVTNGPANVFSVFQRDCSRAQKLSLIHI